ncbi:MAG: gfo/Idh/MocA family oxidoreductase [Spirochaetaceae bacterium]|nr:MAG: gfo/Idh/MocA family oxidoreductase [Spirochaetaceae bacterium]
MKRMRAGIIGVGNISGIYLKNLTTVFSDRVELVGCADLVAERAATTVSEYGLKRAYASVDEMLADDSIELIVNLTIPNAHYQVCADAVAAGKHVYVEKPLCIELDESERLLAAADKRGVRVGGAPDTFLGAGIQTCRKLIDDGWIGKPIAATAFMTCHGHESWHPAPEFYYKKGGGPMFDMGPYYLTALVNLIGPVATVSGSTRVTFPERTITSEPLNGTRVTVDVPTHVVGTLDFTSGAVATIVTSFDVWAANLPRIEIYGTEGSLSVPDPNTFGGPVKILRAGQKEWSAMPLSHAYAENSRGLGVAEMADAIANKRDHRASGALTGHVLEIMHGIHIAADSGSRYTMKSAGVQPQLLPQQF